MRHAHPSATSPAPSRPGRLDRGREGPVGRIVGLDVARGLAVLGMVAAHTVTVGDRPVWEDPASWWELANGRPAVLFGLLAGVSVVLMTGRRRPHPEELPRLRLMLLGRALVIFAIGLVLELLGSAVAVILTFYAALYVLAILVLGLRTRALLVLAGATALVGPPLLAGVDALTPFGGGPGVLYLLGDVYSLAVWSALLFAGMGLARLDLTQTRTAVGAVAAGTVLAAVGYTVGGVWGEDAVAEWEASVAASEAQEAESTAMSASGAWEDASGGGSSAPSAMSEGTDVEQEGVPAWFAGWTDQREAVAAAHPGAAVRAAILSSAPHSGGVMEVLGSGGLALAVVGVAVLGGRRLGALLAPVAAVGALPLTAYSLHVVVLWIVWGPGTIDRSFGLFWALAVGLMVVCWVWRSAMGRGPLERMAAAAGRRMAG